MFSKKLQHKTGNFKVCHLDLVSIGMDIAEETLDLDQISYQILHKTGKI